MWLKTDLDQHCQIQNETASAYKTCLVDLILNAFSVCQQYHKLKYFLILYAFLREGNGTLFQYSCRKIPWMEEPHRLQSMGSLRVGHDWATSLSLFTFMHGEGNGNPLQCFCLENPRDGGAWWAAVYGAVQRWTWLKRLSNSSSKPS